LAKWKARVIQFNLAIDQDPKWCSETIQPDFTKSGFMISKPICVQVII